MTLHTSQLAYTRFGFRRPVMDGRRAGLLKTGGPRITQLGAARRSAGFFWIQYAGLRTLVLILAAGVMLGASAASAPFPLIGKSATDFTLIDQVGRQVRLSQFRGKIVLLNFIYTRCVDVCPITTANLLQVQKKLIQRGWWITDVVFISVTTDPERDTPAILTQYARRYHADLRGWRFLTGDPRQVKKVHEAYGISVRPRENGLQEHHLPTFVIDRRGIVLGAYDVAPNPQDVLGDLEKLR